MEPKLLALLRRYMPALLADAVLQRAMAQLSLAPGQLRAVHIPELEQALEVATRLFVRSEAQAQLMEEMRQLARQSVPPARERVKISTEFDVSHARRRAWSVAQRLGASSFAAQRAATATSELARNILNHAGGGHIEISSGHSARGPFVTLTAVDSGKGIADLEAVLAGTHRSKTGMGKGLMGVKRLASRFEVNTNPNGTTVEADVPL